MTSRSARAACFCGLAESGLRTRYVVLTGSPERQQEARDAAHLFMPGADLTIDLFDLPERPAARCLE